MSEINDLELVPFVDKGLITGQIMLERANGIKSCAGALEAEKMEKNKCAIPAKWEEYVLVFPGALVPPVFGAFPGQPGINWDNMRVAILEYSNDCEWELDRHLIGTLLCDSRYRIVRFKQQKSNEVRT